MSSYALGRIRLARRQVSVVVDARPCHCDLLSLSVCVCVLSAWELGVVAESIPAAVRERQALGKKKEKKRIIRRDSNSRGRSQRISCA
jgi:hypothetical protein